MFQLKFVVLTILSFNCVSFCKSDDPEFENPVIDPKYESKFSQWMTNHNKTYPSITERVKRLTIFTSNYMQIIKLNADNDTAKYECNHFCDLTSKEFLELLTLDVSSLSAMLDSINETDPSDNGTRNIPTEFDWREKGMVTPIKHQGRCGSCWAFSTTANIENVYSIINNGTHKTFSEQQLMDCDHRSRGCMGGWMEYAVQSIIEKGGLVTDDKYPYEGRKRSCRFNSKHVQVQVDRHEKLRRNDEKSMARFVATRNSLMVAVDASRWQHYKSGVFTRCNKRLNHAVLIVGYGNDPQSNLPFWIVKNSWGTGWGEEGYMKIVRGRDACGIALLPSSVVLK